MRLASIRLKGFKRFTDTTITGVPASARLVVLAGPNGSGKSSLFDGFQTWHRAHGAPAAGWDESYGAKVGTEPIGWPDHVSMTFHEPVPQGDVVKKIIYIRSAFRNEADFNISNFNRLPSPLDTRRFARLIDSDVSVSENYQRLIMQTIDGIYDDKIPDETTKKEIRNRLIGEVQNAMRRVFPDLVLTGVGGIGSAPTGTTGTFYFEKGQAKGFLYKNVSAGEKAAFDLILDTVVKREFFDDTIWCIDEPELHLNTRVQGILLETLVDLLPERCQLWIASHSIGFMRKAWEMAQAASETVAFLDLQNIDFDQPVNIQPVQPTREFWQRALDVALGDLALLVAPEHVVLCEGRPSRGSRDKKAEFDASCYRTIFSNEFPETDFLSVGNSDDAGMDRLEIGSAIQALAAGTRVTRLIDRDMRTDNEVDILSKNGVRVLSRRHLEAFLLDDEVITALCHKNGQPDKIAEALQIKAKALEDLSARGKDADDVKSASGDIYVGLRRLLSLVRAGHTWDAFARDTLAPLLSLEMGVYSELKRDIFGS